MPSRTPSFRPPGWRERKAWERPAHKPDKRKRGRAGQRERHAILIAEPFCRSCDNNGQQVQATVVDHITPLAWGGEDTPANKQSLCVPCHQDKSARERAEGRPRG